MLKSNKVCGHLTSSTIDRQYSEHLFLMICKVMFRVWLAANSEDFRFHADTG